MSLETILFTLAISIFALLGMLTFQAVRALVKPNTRNYRPGAYDDAHSRSLWSDVYSSLGSTRFFAGLVVFLTIILGMVLLPAATTMSLMGRQVVPFILFIVLTLLSLLIAFVAIPTSTYLTLISFASVTFAALATALVPQLHSTVVLTLLSIALVANGIVLLQLFMVGRAREVFRARLELTFWCSVAVTVAVLISPLFALVLIGALFLVMLLGAMLVSDGASDTERLLVLLSVLFIVFGLIAETVRPTSPMSAIAVGSGALFIFLLMLLSRTKHGQTSLIAASLLSDPGFALPPPPTMIVLPPKRPYVPSAAREFIEKLLPLSSTITLGIVGSSSEGITWRIAVPANSDVLPFIDAELGAHARDSERVVADSSPEVTTPVWRQLLTLGLVNEYAAPLPNADYIGEHDPLSVLCQRMSGLDEQFAERMEYTVTITAAAIEAKARAHKRLQQGKILPLRALWTDPNNPISGLDEKLIIAKLEHPLPLYHCFVSITIESAAKERLAVLAQAVGDIEQFYLPGHNRLTVIHRSQPFEVTTGDIAYQPDMLRLLEAWKRENIATWRDAMCVLSAPEIAALWHLPSEDYESVSIAWAHGRLPNAVFEPGDGVPLGETITPGMQQKTVYLKPADRAAHHYIAGMTDTGKSTLMLRLLHADILAGRGVAVIDPHGKLIDNLIRIGIPRERMSDVVLLECEKLAYPVPLNPFRRPPGVTIAQAANIVIYALQQIYQDIWLTGRTNEYIENVVQLLFVDEEATPLDIARVFQDKAYLQQLLERLPTSDLAKSGSIYSLRQFWQLYAVKGEREQREILSPIVSRTGVFRRNELMTCHPDMLDCREMIRTNKIVLINLGGDEIKRDVNELATFFLSSFLMGSFSLGSLDDGLPPRFYLYVDEIERMANAPLPQMLSESRKYGLSAVLANQFLDQIPEAMLNAIVGNVGISTIFQVGIKDARFLAPRFEPELGSTDLSNLHRFQIAVKMRLKDKNLPATVLQTRKPKSIQNPISLPELHANVSMNYRASDEVRRWLDGRYGSTGFPSDAPPSRPPHNPPKSPIQDFEPSSDNS